jgi:hypothetical protein
MVVIGVSFLCVTLKRCVKQFVLDVGASIATEEPMAVTLDNSEAKNTSTKPLGPSFAANAIDGIWLWNGCGEG